MHFAISATYGPTDPTRAMLPFLFAASAVQAGDQVTLMLFADSVLMAVEGVGAKLVPVGPPNRYEDIAGHPSVTFVACKPCMEARGLSAAVLDNLGVGAVSAGEHPKFPLEDGEQLLNIAMLLG